MKKKLAILTTLAMTVGVLAGCSGKAATTESDGTASTESLTVEESTEVDSESSATTEAGAVKTGLSIVTNLSAESATAEADGVAKTDISVVAVTVDESGVIQSCVIDGIQANISFSADGKLTTAADSEFPSKNELGEEYGMKAASEIGKEWNEQVAAVAEYAVGKTVDELKNGAIDETGAVVDADLASSATIYIGSFISGIEDAVNNAAYFGASEGDELSLVSITTPGKSKDATAEEDGTAQASANIAAVTMKGDVITSCVIDAVQANVAFTVDGAISGEVNETVATKSELGEDYGLKAYSGIGKEWNEQTAAFCEYVVGKTIDEITGIAVGETGAPTDADLSASVTIAIGDFVALLEKAAK